MPERWEYDERGSGIGSAAEHIGDVDELRSAMRDATWVAEEPEVHLLSHLQQACASPSPWTLQHAELAGSRFEVHLSWLAQGRSRRELRRDAYALLGAVAESSTYVRQRVTADTIVYDVTTGMVGADTDFAPHGHVLRMVVHPME